MQKNSILKKAVALLMSALVMGAFSSCGSSQPCENCDSTPTRGYTNEQTGEIEYYCERCSSDCAFCSDRSATTHYTSAAGIIIFACEECYARMLES